MMMSEFIDRTGFEPTAKEYAKIEKAYYDFDGDKDAFCKAFVKDGDVSVEQYMNNAAKALGGKVSFNTAVRFEKGEGIEKREDNFADEIAKLTHKN